MGASDIIIGVGSDSITLSGAAPLAKVNIIGNLASDVNTITLTEGDDSNSNWEENVIINALGGNDSIDNMKNNVTISGGAGNDTVWNSGKNVSISGGSDNDAIYNIIGESVTIDAGSGDDVIRNYWNSNVVIKYSSGDGNDTIDGLSETTTFSISGDSYTTQTSGTDVLVNIGNGTLNLRNVYNYVDDVHINNETISLSKSITLTDDDDTIETSRNSITVDAGKGDDSISNYKGSNVLFQYASGDGNDIIYGFKANSTLGISGSTYSTAKSGSDIIVSVGDGKITLENAANLSAVNITTIPGGDDTDTDSDADSTVPGVSTIPTEGNDLIENNRSGVEINALGGNEYCLQ